MLNSIIIWNAFRNVFQLCRENYKVMNCWILRIRKTKFYIFLCLTVCLFVHLSVRLWCVCLLSVLLLFVHLLSKCLLSVNLLSICLLPVHLLYVFYLTIFYLSFSLSSICLSLGDNFVYDGIRDQLTIWLYHCLGQFSASKAEKFNLLLYPQTKGVKWGYLKFI